MTSARGGAEERDADPGEEKMSFEPQLGDPKTRVEFKFGLSVHAEDST